MKGRRETDTHGLLKQRRCTQINGTPGSPFLEVMKSTTLPLDLAMSKPHFLSAKHIRHLAPALQPSAKYRVPGVGMGGRVSIILPAPAHAPLKHEHPVKGMARRQQWAESQPLTLLLQSQLALGFDVLQCGGQVARKAARAILGQEGALLRQWRAGSGALTPPHPAPGVDDSRCNTRPPPCTCTPTTVLRPLGKDCGPG